MSAIKKIRESREAQIRAPASSRTLLSEVLSPFYVGSMLILSLFLCLDMVALEEINNQLHRFWERLYAQLFIENLLTSLVLAQGFTATP